MPVVVLKRGNQRQAYNPWARLFLFSSADGTCHWLPMNETLQQKVARVLRDRVEIVSYDASWPAAYEAERRFLEQRFAPELVGRIEHFGSTAVPGLSAKPIIDVLIEVSSLERARVEIAPVLEGLGYDYFWRATHGEDGPPFYAWFIKRDAESRRTHHLHFVEKDFEHWDRLFFRDYLRLHRDVAAQYQALKLELASEHAGDRVAYTRQKSAFIEEVTARARRELETTDTTFTSAAAVPQPGVPNAAPGGRKGTGQA